MISVLNSRVACGCCRSQVSAALTRLLGAALLAAFVVGCGRSAAAPQVVVYAAVDRGDAEPILKRFERQSGIRVLAVYDAEAAKTTGLVARLLAERRRPRCDVFWNNELVQTLLLAQRGALDKYVPRAARELPESFKDPAGLWTAVAQRSRVIVYNTKYVTAEEAPHSIFDLTRPEWRRKAAIANPQFGTTRAHVAALFAVLGPEQTKQWLAALVENEIRIVDGNAMVKNLVARAQPNASPVYVGLTDTDDVMSGLAEGDPIAMIYPDQDELGTLSMPSTVALMRGAPHPDNARKLIDYLAGAEAQAALTGPGSGYLPVRSDLTETDVKTPEKTMSVSRQAWLEQLEPSSRWTNEHFHP